eukprot:4441286-Prymnesium_polylepis.1
MSTITCLCIATFQLPNISKPSPGSALLFGDSPNTVGTSACNPVGALSFLSSAGLTPPSLHGE